MKIYISGKISGIEKEAAKLFTEAEKELIAQGFETVNPMNLEHEHEHSWRSYMRESIKALCDCDEIYMLSNWQQSKGAFIEINLAIGLGLSVRYEETPCECGCSHQ